MQATETVYDPPEYHFGMLYLAEQNPAEHWFTLVTI